MNLLQIQIPTEAQKVYKPFQKPSHNVHNQKHGQQIYRIALTGGPCAGKSTSLAMMQSWLSDRGYKVYTLPETATLMMKAGVSLIVPPNEFSKQVKLQMAIIKNQIHLEDLFYEIAQGQDQNAVLICD